MVTKKRTVSFTNSSGFVFTRKIPDTEPQDYVGPEGKISLKKNAKWTNKDEDKWEKEHIGEYSKSKYWIHKDKSWDIKPCKRHPFDIKSRRGR